MKNVFLDIVQELSPQELENLARDLGERANELRQEENSKREKEAKLKAQQEAFDKKVADFDKSLAKYDELIAEGEAQLQDLKQSRQKVKTDSSEKLFSDEDIEAKSKGGFWDTVLKKPIKDFQFSHLDANVEKLEGSLSRLRAARDQISQERAALITRHGNENRAAKKMESDLEDEMLQQEACSMLGVISRSYLRAEVSINRLREVVELIKTPKWEQQLKRVPGSYPDAHIQLFGGVLQPGRIQQLDFMTLIGYLSNYNLLGDKGTPEYYQRIQGKKEHLEQDPMKKEAFFVRDE